jgi:hypothetical protein
MFIVFESIAGNDPRLLPQLERFHNYWNYTVYRIDEQYISNLDSSLIFATLTDEEGRASMLADAAEGRVTVKPNTDLSTLVLDNISGKPLAEKFWYVLTQDDKTNVISFLKKVLKIHGQKYVKSPEELSLYNLEIDNCQTHEDCNFFMYHYLDVAHWNTGGERNPKFSITW